VQLAAEARGVDPQQHADETVVRFRQAWERLNITCDDFIRTTESRHTRIVEAVLQDLWDRGEITRGEYEGWYCVPCERFWTEKDLVGGNGRGHCRSNCPDCDRPVERIVEPNYFFRMSAYQDWLIDYINAHPDFIRPEIRRNEVLGFLRRPLGDLCISRPASRVSWGIPLPFDPDYVTYVWFDALLNYISVPGYLTDGARFERLWAQVTHLIGKDILTTHAVYWPTMLRAIGLPQPKTIFAHGWWVVRGTKMSKSLGNVARPLDLADIYGVDAFRYFLTRDMAWERDVEFNVEIVAQRYRGDLANDLGNLLHRIVNMVWRYCDGRTPEPGESTDEETALLEQSESLVPQAFERVEAIAPNEALALTMDVVRGINGYLERTAPWKRAKEGQTERVATSLYTAAEALCLCSVLLHPVMPERTAELWRRLGWRPPEPLKDGLAWGSLQPGSPVITGTPLFPRIE
jgi:methionyl-tRNA synthetase